MRYKAGRFLDNLKHPFYREKEEVIEDYEISMSMFYEDAQPEITEEPSEVQELADGIFDAFNALVFLVGALADRSTMSKLGVVLTAEKKPHINNAEED